MIDLYHEGNRLLQDRFDTRRLADRIEERLRRDTFDADDRAFIESRDMFIDFTSPKRLRVNGLASIEEDDPLLDTYAEAQFVVRVRATHVLPNCPRYVHQMDVVEPSRFVPRAGCETPVPDWKRRDWSRDVLPVGDPATNAEPLE